jgi:hypothetical protein
MKPFEIDLKVEGGQETAIEGRWIQLKFITYMYN